MYSSFGFCCAGTLSSPFCSSDGVMSSSGIIFGGIRSTLARTLAFCWSWYGLLVLFNISNFSERSLSSWSPALRLLSLSFLNSLERVLLEGLCFFFAQLRDSSNLYSCSVGDPSFLRTFHLMVLEFCCYWLGALRHSTVRRRRSPDSLHSSRGSSSFRPLEIFPGSYLAEHCFLALFIYVYSAEWSRVHWNGIIYVKFAVFACGDDVIFRNFCSPRGICSDDKLDLRRSSRGGELLSNDNDLDSRQSPRSQ